MAAAVTDAQLAQTISDLLGQRDTAASICPSEVARALAPDGQAWRDLMPAVRRVAAALADRGLLRVTRGDDDVDALRPDGPIRLRRPR
ncbi:MAG: DUF3253 domain-containing protein [Variovorax sp.]|nr:MAG: DUF3253 domain-containing protein [Variovorax sp.]